MNFNEAIKVCIPDNTWISGEDLNEDDTACATNF